MSGERSELKQSLKEDASKIWNKIKDAAVRYGKYGLAALGLTANVSVISVAEQSPEHKQYVQEMNNRGRRFENRLKIHELNQKQNSVNLQNAKSADDERIFVDWDKVAGQVFQAPWLKNNPKQEALDIYNEAVGDNFSGQMSIQDLLEKTGVTKADIQAVVDQNPEMAFCFTPGEKGKAIYNAARRITGLPQGKCLSGMQAIVANSGIGVDIGRNNPDWPKTEIGAGRSNSACNISIPLEKSGQFITVELNNEAYQKKTLSPEYRKMQELNSKIPIGTIVSIDNKLPDEVSGRRARTNSEKHGHTWTSRGNGEYASDGVERNIHFSNYGKKMYLSYASDCSVPKEMALKCIEQAQIRQQKEQQLAQNHVLGLQQTR